MLNLNILGGNLFGENSSKNAIGVSFMQNITMPFILGKLHLLGKNIDNYYSHAFYKKAFCYPLEDIKNTNFEKEEGQFQDQSEEADGRLFETCIQHQQSDEGTEEKGQGWKEDRKNCHKEGHEKVRDQDQDHIKRKPKAPWNDKVYGDKSQVRTFMSPVPWAGLFLQ